MTDSTDDTPDSGELLADIIPAAAPPPRRRRGRPPQASERLAAECTAKPQPLRRRTATGPSAPAEQTTLRLIEEAVPVPPLPQPAATAAALGGTACRAARQPQRAAIAITTRAASNTRGSPMHAQPQPRAQRADARVSPRFASRRYRDQPST